MAFQYDGGSALSHYERGLISILVAHQVEGFLPPIDI